MTPSLLDVSVAVNVTFAGHVTLARAELSTATVAVVMANDAGAMGAVVVVDVVVVDEGAKGLGNPAQAVVASTTAMIPDAATNVER